MFAYLGETYAASAGASCGVLGVFAVAGDGIEHGDGVRFEIATHALKAVACKLNSDDEALVGSQPRFLCVSAF